MQAERLVAEGLKRLGWTEEVPAVSPAGQAVPPLGNLI